MNGDPGKLKTWSPLSVRVQPSAFWCNTHAQVNNTKAQKEREKERALRAHRRVVISCDCVLFWPCWHGSVQPVQTNYSAMWFTSIKGGQRPNVVQSEAEVDRFASHLWLWNEFLAEKSCEVPLCSLGGTLQAQRWSTLHPQVWNWGAFDALMCLGVCVCVWECGGSELL